MVLSWWPRAEIDQPQAQEARVIALRVPADRPPAPAGHPGVGLTANAVSAVVDKGAPATNGSRPERQLPFRCLDSLHGDNYRSQASAHSHNQRRLVSTPGAAAPVPRPPLFLAAVSVGPTTPGPGISGQGWSQRSNQARVRCRTSSWWLRSRIEWPSLG